MGSIFDGLRPNTLSLIPDRNLVFRKGKSRLPASLNTGQRYLRDDMVWATLSSVTPDPDDTGIYTFMIQYVDYHDDSVIPNPIYTIIMNSRPTVLYMPTPGGIYSSPTRPDLYEANGTQVYSYFTCGYGGYRYPEAGSPDYDDLTANLARIATIKAEGCTGIMLDEVWNMPDGVSVEPTYGCSVTTHKAYVQAMWDECQNQGVKMIVNTGTSEFDQWLLDRCNYILTGENWAGAVKTADQIAAGNKCMVCTYPTADLTTAVANTQDAWSKGFRWHYSAPTVSYNLASWTSSYFEALYGGAPPTTPGAEAHTTSDTLYAVEAGSTHTNEGATGPITLTLPTGATVGDQFTFRVSAAYPLYIMIAGALDCILLQAGAQCDDGGADMSIWSATVGQTVVLECVVTSPTTQWAAITDSGGWYFYQP